MNLRKAESSVHARFQADGLVFVWLFDGTDFIQASEVSIYQLPCETSSVQVSFVSCAHRNRACLSLINGAMCEPARGRWLNKLSWQLIERTLQQWVWITTVKYKVDIIAELEVFVAHEFINREINLVRAVHGQYEITRTGPLGHSVRWSWVAMWTSIRHW